MCTYTCCVCVYHVFDMYVIQSVYMLYALSVSHDVSCVNINIGIHTKKVTHNMAHPSTITRTCVRRGSESSLVAEGRSEAGAAGAGIGAATGGAWQSMICWGRCA